MVSETIVPILLRSNPWQRYPFASRLHSFATRPELFWPGRNAIRAGSVEGLTAVDLNHPEQAGGDILTLWRGQHGVDHPIQADRGRLWDMEVDGIRQFAGHDAKCLTAIEHWSNEPRSISLLSDISSTLLAIAEVGAPNLGVTLDFAHVLQADE